jgi:hypothetical protein
MSLKHTLMLAAVAAVAVGVDGTSPPQTDRSGSKGVQPARRYWAQPSTVQRPMLPFASSPAPVTTAQSAGPGLTTASGAWDSARFRAGAQNSPIGGERSGPNLNSPIVACAVIAGGTPAVTSTGLRVAIQRARSGEAKAWDTGINSPIVAGAAIASMRDAEGRDQP